MHVLLVHLRSLVRLMALTVAMLPFFMGAFAEYAHAAEVTISPSTGTYAKGQSFTTNIQVNPQSKSVNAVEAKLTFDNTKFAVVSISKTGSVFSLWTTEPTFSNSAGTIDFGGGSPTPFSVRSNIMSVTFRTLAEGSGNVSVSTASVLAADGLGTNVYTGAGNASYTISGADVPPPPPPEPTPTDTPPKEKPASDNAAITFGDPPRAPEAGSTVFLDPDKWYATKVGLFTWEVPFDVDAMALDIATSSDAEATTEFDVPVSEMAFNDTMLIDGVQYLTMKFKNQVGWGATLHRKIMIDTIPPEKFPINVRAGNSATAFPLLNFEASDSISGIDRYEMKVADREVVTITPDEAKLGYLLKDLEDGTYTVKVSAFDRAGNETVSSVPVLITAGWKPPQEIVIANSFWDLLKGKNLAIILLILIIIALVTYIVSIKKAAEQKEQKLRKETKEIQDQMEKIFSALRDEIYDQINMITKRERLSKKEREAVEGLNQAIEVSETLIEKEITDVSKILK